MALLSLQQKAVQSRLLLIFTWFTRIMLALAFLPSGLKKVLGLRFTSQGIENPVGFFFEALYQTGWYWNFLGIFQLTAAALLLIPRTSFLGALLYFPIAINIFAIVLSLHFSGTPVVVGFMLLGNLWLLLWEYPKLHLTAVAIFKKQPL